MRESRPRARREPKPLHPTRAIAQRHIREGRQHRDPGLSAGRIFTVHQTVIDQPPDAIEKCVAGHRGLIRHRFQRVQTGPAREDRRPPENRLFQRRK